MEQTITLSNKVLRVLIALAMLAPLSSFGQQVEEVRNINKSYAVKQNVSIDVSNKYGDIRLEEWAKDSVRIEIELLARAGNQDRLEKLFGEISFEINGTDYFVTAKTSIKGQRTQLFEEFNELAELIFTGDNEVRIDYKVFFPASATIEVENKYGNVYMDNLNAELRLNMAHGDLFAGNINGNTQISLKFGDGRVNQIKSGRMVLEYSDFQLNTAERLVLDSKSSTINIRDINELKASSKRDKFRIDNINVLNGGSQFTDYFVDELDKSLNLTAKYGTLNIRKIPGTFSSFTINANYTDLEFNFEESASYKVDVTCRSADFKYPENIAKINKSFSDDMNRTMYKGTIGSNNAPNATIKVEANNCDVRFDH